MNTKNADLRFVHVRTPNNKGFTVAYKFDDANNRITWAASRCGKKDSFNRKIGRAVSSGRLEALQGTTDEKSVPYSTFGEKLSYQSIAGFFFSLFAANVA